MSSNCKITGFDLDREIALDGNEHEVYELEINSVSSSILNWLFCIVFSLPSSGLNIVICGGKFSEDFLTCTRK